MLSAVFGILATLLAAIGLYGVMAFVVARRTREIGLRMALGARRALVVWMVMRETIVLVGGGSGAGDPGQPAGQPVRVNAVVRCQADGSWRGRGGAVDSGGGGGGRGFPAGAAREYDRPDSGIAIRIKGEASMKYILVGLLLAIPALAEWQWEGREEARRAMAEARRSRMEAMREVSRARSDARRELYQAQRDVRRSMYEARREAERETRQAREEMRRAAREWRATWR